MISCTRRGQMELAKVAGPTISDATRANNLNGAALYTAKGSYPEPNTREEPMARSSRSQSVIDSLEPRRLFSSIALSSTGALNVLGNANFANQITVAENTAGTSITATVKSNGVTLTRNFTVASVK